MLTWQRGSHIQSVDGRVAQREATIDLPDMIKKDVEPRRNHSIDVENIAPSDSAGVRLADEPAAEAEHHKGESSALALAACKAVTHQGLVPLGR